jgi:hypothetical protein
MGSQARLPPRLLRMHQCHVEFGAANSRIPRVPKLTNPASLRNGVLSSVPPQRLTGKREPPPFVPQGERLLRSSYPLHLIDRLTNRLNIRLSFISGIQDSSTFAQSASFVLADQRFAAPARDSPLEGDGFEPSVPRSMESTSRAKSGLQEGQPAPKHMSGGISRKQSDQAPGMNTMG